MKRKQGAIYSLATSSMIGLLSLISFSKTALAQVFFDNPREFRVTRNCNATTSIRTRANPTPVNIGESYQSLGENKRTGATHALISINGMEKWLALECGQYGNISGETPQPVFAPFFDNANNLESGMRGGPADMTPVPPEPNEFDRAVVEVCGAPGKIIERLDFINLMNRFPDVLGRIREAVGGRVFADRPVATSDATFLEELADAWVDDDTKGFEHIFCGEPDSDKVGGLHFYARYLQLQQAQLAGRILNNEEKEEVNPGLIYTMGVVMLYKGERVSSRTKGYGLTLNGEEILLIATKAFRDHPTDSTASEACLLDVSDQGEDFQVVFVRRVRGIRTFYPDAFPNQPDPAPQACN